jgi:hypothetical protein
MFLIQLWLFAVYVLGGICGVADKMLRNAQTVHETIKCAGCSGASCTAHGFNVSCVYACMALMVWAATDKQLGTVLTVHATLSRYGWCCYLAVGLLWKVWPP